MGRKKAHTPEEIVAKLRQGEVLIGQGKMRIPMMSAACSGAMSAIDSDFMSAGHSD